MSAAKLTTRNDTRFRPEIQSPAARVQSAGRKAEPALGPAEHDGDPLDNGFAATSASDSPLGVYIHFPWCKRKCPYCDFLSVASDRIPSEAYAEAILAELRRRSASLADRTVASIFIGGGTPSLWEPRALARVLDAVHTQLRVAEHCEITAEANPSSLNLGRAQALHAAGVNRLSIGVQSLRSERLRFLGRLHDPEQARAAVVVALEAGIPRVSVDLIFGLPHQPPGEAAADAVELVGLGIEHVSAYALTIEPGTAFGARALHGKLPTAVDDDVANAFSSVRAELLERGFDHYEISNYARPGGQARHNVGYWIGRDYLGLGCAAWGTLTEGQRSVRYRNTPSPSRYLEAASNWESADLTRAGSELLQCELEELPPETRLFERLMLGLRLSAGIDIDGVARELGVSAWDERRTATYERLLQDCALERVGRRTRIAPDHWLVTDTILTQLL